MSAEKWQALKEATLTLANSLDSYLTYMKSQTKKMALHHTTTSLSVADRTSVKVLPKNISPPKSLWKLNDDVLKKQQYLLMIMRRQTVKNVISLSKT